MQGVTDPFAGAGSEPSREVITVVTNDGVDLAKNCRAIYVGVGGNVKITDLSGATPIFVGVPAGTILPVCASRIWATGTSALSLLALV